MFVDASAIVAILTREPDSRDLADLLEAAAHPITSPIAVFEAVLAIRRILRLSPEVAAAVVENFLAMTGTSCVAISPAVTALALDAHARYGKGQGHPAQLNMGDCFAYAAARYHGTTLLYKGNDFRQTDIRSA